MKKKILKFILWANVFAFSSCNLDGLQTNPNLLTPDQADITFLLNKVEVEFGTNFFYNATYPTMDLTRMKAMINGSNYNNSYTPSSFDVLWNSFYATMVPDINTAIKLGTSTQQTNHTGIARVLKAYTLTTMVDLFGDIPYSDAFNSSNFNPTVDKGSVLYDTALNMLDRAIADLSIKTPKSYYSSDVFYPQDAAPADWSKSNSAKWITLANTLKLRIYLQRRLVDANAHAEIQAIVSAGDFIDKADGSEDFVFPYYGNSITNPDTRSPSFVNNYLNGGADYMSNSLMLQMYDYNNQGTGIQDPRLRYYFYRQTTSPGTDVNIIACAGLPPPTHYPAGTAWCQDPAGYWGRDHLNNDGINPDTKDRTIWGIYPAGGKFDADDGVPGTINDGNAGKGFWPIVTSSFVNFMLAEDALLLGNDVAGAKTYLNNGVSQSITKVMSVYSGATKVPTASAINNYKAQVLSDYDASTDQWQVISKEYWKAFFGNGIDVFNEYRRTGYPKDMQPARNPTPGNYYRSLTYPSVYVTRNSNSSQHEVAAQIFWDTNPADPWIISF